MMKRTYQIIIALVLIALAAILYILPDKYQAYQIIQMKGAQVYSNLTKSDMTWMVGNNYDSLSAMPLCENDIVCIIFDDEDNEFVYRYHQSDGHMLEFKKQDLLLLLNDKLISIKITDDDKLKNWLEEVSYEKVKDLRSIFISDKFNSLDMKYLTRLSELKPEIGIYIDSQAEVTDSVLRLFKPLWLMDFNSKYSPEAIQKISQSGNIDLLRIDASLNDLNDFASLAGIKTLFIANLKQPEAGQKLKLPKGLKTLSISESGIRNLDFLKASNHLRSLSITECESLIDINAMNELSGLKTLNLIACDSLRDINFPGKAAGLRWISFPNSVSQKEFDIFIINHQSIEVIDLIGCDSIRDFTRISGLKKLCCLNIYKMEVTIDSLVQLKNLKFMSLPETIMDDSLSVSVLKEKLPDTIIVPSTGICLGTGWVLLIIPFIILSGLCVIYYRRMGYGKNSA